MTEHKQMVSLCLAYLNQVNWHIHQHNHCKMTTNSRLLYNQLLSSWDQLHHNITQYSMPPHEQQSIIFALAAYTDERALAAPSENPLLWLRYSLHKKYFQQSQHAGIEFFNKLNHLLENKTYHILQIYLYCLQLGFSGKYSTQEKTSPKESSSTASPHDRIIGNSKSRTASTPLQSLIRTIKDEIRPFNKTMLCQLNKPKKRKMGLLYACLICFSYMSISISMNSKRADNNLVKLSSILNQHLHLVGKQKNRIIPLLTPEKRSNAT